LIFNANLFVDNLFSGIIIPLMIRVKEQITKSCIQLLRPLIKMLIRHNVSQSEFVEISRRAYVDVAFADFAIPGKPKTVSHAAVVTGLSRKEVLRIQKLKGLHEPIESSHINRASRVVSGWMHDKNFIGKDGKPLPLPVKGKEPSFEILVKRYSGDITWGAVLDEMLRVKTITINNNNEVVLLNEGYIPSADISQKFIIIGECGSDFFETISHNLDENQAAPRFQRSVAYNNIPEEKVREFEGIAKQKSEALLSDFNKWLANNNCPTEKQKPDSKYLRIGLGIYYFNNDAGGAKKYDMDNK